jgi:hypothetical protein
MAVTGSTVQYRPTDAQAAILGTPLAAVVTELNGTTASLTVFPEGSPMFLVESARLDASLASPKTFRDPV